ncbi:MAG TPA: hypothetical protein VMW41_05745 [Candidatus Bathyarchaeia archaeon]|nr:hypothetical protein [Candidatus Bathyarchaeia archaeon]
MKVWFGTTTTKLLEYKDYYFAIRNYLIELGFVITGDWLEEAYEYKKSDPEGKRDIKNVYKTVLQAIDQADFSVIEYTVPNFSSSHQIYYSIQKRKPTLVMRLFRDNSFADSYIEALESRFLTVKLYDLKSYQAIIDEFIGYCKLEKGYSRYNIVLDKSQKYFLDWAANKYRKSRSQIIRNLISKEIKKDNKYKKYLSCSKLE